MDNLMYYEEEEIIHYAEYEKLREKVGGGVKKNVWKLDDVRMQSFHNKSIVLTKESEKTVFYLEMNKATKSYHFIKKVKQNHIIYEAFVTISEEGCKKLLRQNIDWMRKENNPLLYEFSLLCETNKVELDAISECRRERYELNKQSSVFFVHNLKYAKNADQNFFDHDPQMLDCLNCDQVILTVRKNIAFPIRLRQSMPISC